MRIHGAFILARYSTDRQNPDSIEVQVSKCTQWCNENHMPILGVFADMAVSGMKDTRPQYELMMTQLRQGMADTVVIYDQSRMFRKMTAWFAFRDQLSVMGVTVVSVTQPQIGKDLRDPTNFVTEGSMALFNQMHALITRQKVIEKMRFMARNGLHTGGVPPLGFSVKEGRLVICEGEADVVRRIFSEYAAGRSYREIMAGLNADGISTRSGKPFGTNSLHDLLKNEKYIGVLVYGKTPRGANNKRNSHAPAHEEAIRIEGAYPPIISADTWERVQMKLRLNKRDHSGRPATVRNYPLKGKVFCGECGAALIHTATNTKRGPYHYYACSGKQRLKNCEMMPIKMSELEQIVAETARAVWSEPGNAEKLIGILRAQRDTLHNASAGRLQALVSRQNDIARQLDQATTAVLNGLNSSTLTAKIMALEAEKNTITAQISQLKKDVDAASIPDFMLNECLALAYADDVAVLATVVRVEVSRDTIQIWTILDSDDGDDMTQDNIKSTHMIMAEGLSFSPKGELINILGHGSPAPKTGHPFRGVLFLVLIGIEPI